MEHSGTHLVTPTAAAILERHDRGETVSAIADAEKVSASFVYSVLRDQRPERPRKARAATSDKPRLIAGLAAQGIKPARIAVVLGVSRAYVYRHLGESS